MTATDQHTSENGDAHLVIARYVAELAGFDGIADDEPLISAHVLDSLAAVQIVEFVESAFGITIADEDLELENFDTLAGLVALVTGKLAGR